MIKTFNAELQNSYDRKSIYKTEIQTGFKNIKNIKKDMFIDVPEKKKISSLAKLLNEVGLTRSDFTHDSEDILRRARENGAEIINIIPFLTSFDLLNKLIKENNKRKTALNSPSNGRNP